ncbi:hypothetical protein HYH46_15850 [Clostridium botulinum]|nr:hypothetical protein [Clostridium botulinum]
MFKIPNKSRADYFRERRRNMKHFGASLNKELVEEFETILEEKNKTKKDWLEEKICEELYSKK